MERTDLAPHGFFILGTEPEYEISNPNFPFADAGGFHHSQNHTAVKGNFPYA